MSSWVQQHLICNDWFEKKIQFNCTVCQGFTVDCQKLNGKT